MRNCRSGSGSIRPARWPMAPTDFGCPPIRSPIAPRSFWKALATAGSAHRPNAPLDGLDVRTRRGSWMSSTRLAFIAVAIAAGMGVAFACGPFFPWQLLDDRAETVSDPVALSFAFEVKRLV